MIGIIPYAAIRFATYDALARAHRRATGAARPSARAALAFGAAAGVASATATFPLEVARRRMMVGALGPGGAPFPHLAAALWGVAAAEGAGALWSGAWVSVVKQAPQYAISFAAFESAKHALDL